VGDVAADGGDFERAGIGRVKEAVGGGGFVNLLGDNARFGEEGVVAGVDFEEAIEALEAEDDRARMGTLPPLRPVPEPRGTTGAPCARAMRRTAATCAASPGKTTAAGAWRLRAAVPSKA